MDTTLPCSGHMSAFNGVTQYPVMLANQLNATHTNWIGFGIDLEPLRRCDHRLVPRPPDGRHRAPEHVLRRQLRALSGHRDLADPAQNDGLGPRFFAWRPAGSGLRCAALVIRLDSVSKQHGWQILFLEASISVFRGERWRSSARTAPASPPSSA